MIVEVTKMKHPFSDGTIKELKKKASFGAGSVCPKCGKRGNFASIIRQREKEGTFYICCGWCGAITKEV